MTVVIDSNILISHVLADEPLNQHATQILATWRANDETFYVLKWLGNVQLKTQSSDDDD